MAARKISGKMKSLMFLTAGGGLTFSTICIKKGDEQFYESVLMPSIHKILNPERAHRFAIVSAKWGLIPQSKYVPTGTILETTLWGMKFNNPIGIAAGFDKDGEAVSGLFKTGVGFLEVGSVTPLPQDGNPKPRLFRLSADKAIINRNGFCNKGHDFVKTRVRGFDKERGILGINLGKNKLSESAEDDYVKGIKEFAPIADYIVINISSPNTPGLRNLQQQASLEQLLDKVIEARNNINHNKMVEISIDNQSNSKPVKENKVKPPILVKIAPDLTYDEKKDIAQTLQRKGKEIDGLIVCNTTISRPASLSSSEKSEVGGLSGKPLFPISIRAIKDMYHLTKGEIPIIGVGGVSSGKDAYEMIRAGASLVQLYSALVYSGPPLIDRIKRDLENLLKADGFSNVSEAVGADHKGRGYCNF